MATRTCLRLTSARRVRLCLARAGLKYDQNGDMNFTICIRSQTRELAAGLLSLLPIMNRICSTVVIFVLCLFVVPLLEAQNYWTGNAGDNLWSTAANWSLGVTPDATQDVFIPDSASPVILNVSAETASLTLGSTEGSPALNIVGGPLHCHGAGSIQTNAVLNLNGRIITDALLQVDGTINSGGSAGITGMVTVGPSGNLNIAATGPLSFSSILLNQGTISSFATSLQLADTFNNQGTFRIEANCNVFTTGSGNLTFYNSGTILAPAGSGNTALTISGNFTNSGTIKAETNASLQLQIASFSGAAADFRDGTVFDGEGLVQLTAYQGPSSFEGNITVNCSLDYYCDQIGGNSFWSGSGLFRWRKGNIGGFTFQPGFHAETVSGLNKTVRGYHANYGAFSWTDGSTIGEMGSSAFYNYGQFIVQSNCTISIGEFPKPGFQNLGDVLVPANVGTSR